MDPKLLGLCLGLLAALARCEPAENASAPAAAAAAAAAAASTLLTGRGVDPGYLADLVANTRACGVPVFHKKYKNYKPNSYPRPLTSLTGTTWPAGSPAGTPTVLRVYFNGAIDQGVKDRVAAVAQEWMRCAFVTFEFGTDPSAEIKISFDRSQGAWSAIGTEALLAQYRVTTMNLGWLTPSTDDAEFRRTVLHQFGHALSFVHEHQHPDRAIPWDTTAAYAYFKATRGWGRSKVSTNVLAAKSLRDQTQFYSGVDTTSIMAYPVPSKLTTSGYSRPWNSQLSPADCEFAERWYPFPKSTATKYDAAILHPNGKAYFFSGDKYYRFDFARDRLDKIARIGVDGWTGIPPYLDAAYNRVWPNPPGAIFVKGSHAYHFNYNLDKVDFEFDIPLGIFQGQPSHLDDACFHPPNGKWYYFYGGTYARLASYAGGIERIGTTGVTGWAGVPPNVDAIVQHPEGDRSYFFYGRRYYRFNYGADQVDKANAEVGVEGWLGL